MSSIQYFNQSAPFWDFVASFEDQAFKQASPDNKEESSDTENAETQRPSEDAGYRPGPWGHCGGSYGRRGPCGGRRGGRGFHRGPMGMGLNPFLQFLQSQLNPNQDDDSESKDFQPPVDVFSTPSAYHIHVSLPGAKKEDVGLNYDADKSELSIAGVIYRPGDEEFLKTLSMSERKVGVFDRKVRLGNERHPAEVDVDGITAKLEDGILRIELPRIEKEYVNVKKVDIE